MILERKRNRKVNQKKGKINTKEEEMILTVKIKRENLIIKLMKK